MVLRKSKWIKTMHKWCLIDPVGHLTWCKVFFVTWGVKRRIWHCCKYWRFVQNLIACVNFEACFKGQRWIVCTHASHSWGAWKLMSCCNGAKHSDFVCFMQKNSNQESFLCASFKRFGSSTATLFPVYILFHHSTGNVLSVCLCVSCVLGASSQTIWLPALLCVCLGCSKRLWQQLLGSLFSKEGEEREEGGHWFFMLKVSIFSQFPVSAADEDLFTG